MSHLREFCNNVGNEWLIHNSKNTIRRLCISILAEWIHEISCIQDADDIVSYGCTLIAYVQTKHFWLALQIGDGRCVVLNKANEWSQPIPWDDRCMLNMTTSLCDEDAVNEFRLHTEMLNLYPKLCFSALMVLMEHLAQEICFMDFMPIS